MVELVREEVQDMVKGRFLEGAPIIPVSSVTGENIDVLRTAIRQKAAEVEEKSRQGIFRLPVDRVFTIKGFGTIVTGTCISGAVRAGDEIQIYPTDKRARVRTAQAYHEDVKEAGAGQRVALNLQGVEKQEIERGTIVGRPESLLLTSRIDASLRYLKLPFKPIKNNTILRFHIATTQVEARLILLDRPELEPGDEAFVQFVFAEPIVVLPGDRFILRGSYAIQTLGGGTVLDIAPGKHKRLIPGLEAMYLLLRTGTTRQKVEYNLEKAGFKGFTKQHLAVLLGAHQDVADKIVADLAALGSARVIGKMVVSAGRFGTYKETLKALLSQFHEKNPLKIGISREELRTRLPDVDPVIFQAALEDAAKAGDAEIEKDRVRLSGGTGKPDESIGKLEGQVAAMLEARGLTPPTTQEMADELRIKERSLRDILEKLVYAGKVVKVKSDMYLAARHMEELKSLVKEELTKRKEMLPADFKAMTGLSRKYMIPLLEYLDEIKLTIRSGDKRVLRSG
jgi:selenocysteine-specific elongation factor